MTDSTSNEEYKTVETVVPTEKSLKLTEEQMNSPKVENTELKTKSSLSDFSFLGNPLSFCFLQVVIMRIDTLADIASRTIPIDSQVKTEDDLSDFAQFTSSNNRVRSFLSFVS